MWSGSGCRVSTYPIKYSVRVRVRERQREGVRVCMMPAGQHAVCTTSGMRVPARVYMYVMYTCVCVCVCVRVCVARCFALTGSVQHAGQYAVCTTRGMHAWR